MINEALPGVWGNKGIYFRGTREQRTKSEGKRGTKAIWGTGNIGNQDFDFGEQSNLFQGNKGTGILPWEGLVNWGPTSGAGDMSSNHSWGTYQSNVVKNAAPHLVLRLTHICRMDLSILIIWMSPFWILVVSGVLCHFYLILDRKSWKASKIWVTRFLSKSLNK